MTASTDAAPVILVVDDDRNGRESLRRGLVRDGYNQDPVTMLQLFRAAGIEFAEVSVFVGRVCVWLQI